MESKSYFILCILLFIVTGCLGGSNKLEEEGITGSVSVSWVPPTENINNSALVITGYKFYIGSSPNVYETVIEAPAGITEYLLEGVPVGSAYIAMTAINDEDFESPFSNEIQVTISEN